MPMNRDRSVLYVNFAAALLHLDALLKEQNLPFSLFVGYRTFAEQDALYAQGRSVNVKGKKVTNAKGGYSWHNYGLAADYVAHPRESIWSWDESVYNYEAMAKLAVECGLTAGYFWMKERDGFGRDAPHVQYKHSMPISVAYALYSKDNVCKVENVWNELVNYQT
jgi:peptidoglycan L-alanyl-D-glutamate endopeptidase CwlK